MTKKEYNREWRKKHPEYYKVYKKSYRKKHPEKIKEYRLRHKRKLKSNPETVIRYVIHGYKHSAKRHNKPFLLLKEEVELLINSPCHYCGIINGNGERNGIDRKDNELGYFIGNVVSCCWKCNKLKSATKYEDFLKRIIDIYTHLFSK